MFAVIPARNEAKRIATALRTVLQTGVERVVVVVNGCEDETARVVGRFGDPRVTMLHFEEALGPDVPRAVGAAYAYGEGARHVLFYDGDLIGQHADALRGMVAAAKRFDLDLVLSDTYGTTHELVDSRDLLIRLRYELNDKLGLVPRIGLANPAHGPHIVSRRLLKALPLTALAKPPLVLAHAAQAGLRIDALAYIPHARLGSAHKGPPHFEQIRDTIIGDLLEAHCLLQGRPRSREYRGQVFDGYQSVRRFDLLQAYVEKLALQRPEKR
ncbi:MAG TPA: glycosyltransferase [Bacilli bacterium]|nr:glycosyltransferase [Bacilli bacterium]